MGRVGPHSRRPRRVPVADTSDVFTGCEQFFRPGYTEPEKVVEVHRRGFACAARLGPEPDDGEHVILVGGGTTG